MEEKTELAKRAIKALQEIRAGRAVVGNARVTAIADTERIIQRLQRMSKECF